jgi:hypothetical protein
MYHTTTLIRPICRFGNRPVREWGSSRLVYSRLDGSIASWASASVTADHASRGRRRRHCRTSRQSSPHRRHRPRLAAVPRGPRPLRRCVPALAPRRCRGSVSTTATSSSRSVSPTARRTPSRTLRPGCMRAPLAATTAPWAAWSCSACSGEVTCSEIIVHICALLLHLSILKKGNLLVTFSIVQLFKYAYTF